MMSTMAKALVGAAIGATTAGLSAAVLALDDNGISSQEWVKIALAAVVALGANGYGIWRTPNRSNGVAA